MKNDNNRRTEPVVLLPLVQNELQRPEPRRQQSEAKVVQLQPLPRRLCHLALDVRRILHQSVRQVKTQQRHRHVDEEDPSPVVVIRDPPAQRRPDRRRAHHRQPVQGKCLPPLLRRKRIRQNRLFRRRQPASAGSLNHPEEHQPAQRRRQPAQHGADPEQHHADHVELLAPDEGRQIRRGRQNNRIRHQVAGQHPGRLVVARAQRPGNMRQRHVGDGGVQHLHKRRQRHRNGDGPLIGARLPCAIRRRLCCLQFV